MENELRRIIDALPGFAWSALPDGRVEFANKRWHEYTGSPPDEPIDAAWQSAIHPQDVRRWRDGWRSPSAPSAVWELELRLRRFDGAYRWFLCRASPLTDESGQIVEWCGISMDIDDRRQAESGRVELVSSEDAIRASERNLALTVNTIPAMLWSVTVDGRAEFFNQHYLDFTGLTAERASDWGWATSVHPDDMSGLAAAWMRITASEARGETEARLRRHDGEYRWFLLRANPLRDENGRIVKWYGMNTDIEDRKRAEEALNRARTELAHVTRVSTLSALTASVAHEVNQPLSGIITNASTCLRMLDTNPPNIQGARETARRTLRDGNRASDVVTRLRALFSKKEFTFEALDLNEATREVIALSSSELRRYHVELQSELADDLPSVSGDRVQLQQVILNLIRNAVDAMAGLHERPRQLLIRTEREERDRVRVTVRDAGVGVDRKNIDELFDAFYTTKSEGMGVGLSVSRSIIESHRGRIWATPNEDVGSTFAFSIPSGSRDEATTP